MLSNKNIKLYIFLILLIIIFLWLIYIFFNLNTFQFFQDIYQPGFRFYNYDNTNLWLNRKLFIFSVLLFIIIYILILIYTLHLLFNISLNFFSNLFYFLGSIFIFVISILIFYFDYLGNYTCEISRIEEIGYVKWLLFLPDLFFISDNIGVRAAFISFFLLVNIIILQLLIKINHSIKIVWYFLFINCLFLFIHVSLGFIELNFLFLNFEYVFTPEDKIFLLRELLLDPIYSHLKPFDNEKIFSFMSTAYLSLIQESDLLSDLLIAMKSGLDNLPYSFYVLLYGSQIVNMSFIFSGLLLNKVLSLSLVYLISSLFQVIFIPWFLL